MASLVCISLIESHTLLSNNSPHRNCAVNNKQIFFEKKARITKRQSPIKAPIVVRRWPNRSAIKPLTKRPSICPTNDALVNPDCHAGDSSYLRWCRGSSWLTGFPKDSLNTGIPKKAFMRLVSYPSIIMVEDIIRDHIIALGYNRQPLTNVI